MKRDQFFAKEEGGYGLGAGPLFEPAASCSRKGTADSIAKGRMAVKNGNHSRIGLKGIGSTRPYHAQGRDVVD